MATRQKRLLKKRKTQVGSAPAYPFKFRLKVARLHVEDGYPARLLAQQFGISDHSVYRWSNRYRLLGEQGLMDRARKVGGSKLPAAVTENIIELKKENPGRDARRISDILKRFFLVGGKPLNCLANVERARTHQRGKTQAEKEPCQAALF